MKTISEIVSDEVSKMPFVEEAMEDNLINLSSLARLLKPSVEKALMKPVKDGAIVMALNRYAPMNHKVIKLKSENVGQYFGDIFVRSGLMTCSYESSPSLTESQTRLLHKVEENIDAYCSFKQGMYERTLILSENLKEFVDAIFCNEKFISGKSNLCSVTVKLKESNVEVYGLYYYIFKMIAWHGINIIEVVSTANEFTIVVEDNNINTAFSVLMQIKSDALAASLN